MKQIDYYKILGVPREASADDIRKAYYSLAKKYHPDLNSNAKDKYLLITEAYSILGDLDKRLDYALSLYDDIWKDLELTDAEIISIFGNRQKKL